MTHIKHFEKVESNRDRRFSMSNSPRMKLLTLCIGAALAQMAGFNAMADSAVGVDTAIGNAANPGYASSGPVERDADAPPVLRTPTGQMYSYPPLKDEGVAKGQVTGHVDIGYMGSSDQTSNSKRNEYSVNNKSGVYLNNFDVSSESDGAAFFTVNGGGVGRHDQFYELRTGKLNNWKLRAFYNETKHVFTDTWKSLFTGEGSGNLVTGLENPTMYVNPGAYTGGVNNYIGANATNGCTATAPCWSYGGYIYGNTVAMSAINGVTGTPNATTGAIATSAGVGATGAVQSNMAAAIAAKLAATPYSELSLIRKKTGLRSDVNLSDSVKAYVSYSLEKRVGARPFALNDGNNISYEFAEPIDYNTHDILAGLSYADELTQANLRTSVSLFRNNISTLNIQYPLLGSAAPQGVIQHATLDLAPDNDAFNIKGEFARSLPDLWKGRFTASASWGSNRQNDALLAPISEAQSADLAAAGVTTLTGANAGYATNSLQVSNWNTTAALSQKNAGQRIDNKMVDLGLSMKPSDDLSMKASYRFFEALNKGGYVAYNPLTGQFGRGPSTGNGTGAADLVVAPDGQGGCYALPGFPATGCSTNGLTLANGANAPVFGQARTTRQANYGISADYELSNTSSVNGAFEREDFYRTFRERAKTEENKVKLGYVNRALADSTLRVSYEQDTKRGSDYRYRTFEDLGTGLPGLDVATQVALAGQTVGGATYPTEYAANGNSNLLGLFSRYSYYFRKYDQANRDQKIFNTRVNYLASADLDVGLNLQVKRVNYPEDLYGLKKDNQDSIGVDMSYQPSFDRTITAFYNYQKGTKSMDMNSGTAITANRNSACSIANLNQFGYVACSDTTNGIDGQRPDASRWSSETFDHNNVLGLGLQEDLGFARLGVDYTFARSSTHIAYNYGSAAFNATAASNAAMQLLAGTALPDMTTEQNTLTLNLVKPLDKKTTVRAMYRFDGMRVKDWHYDGVIMNQMTAMDGNATGAADGTLLLDSGPVNYHANTFGVFLNYKL